MSMYTDLYTYVSDQEIHFGLEKKVLAATDILNIDVYTNSLLNCNDTYLLVVKQREKFVYN